MIYVGGPTARPPTPSDVLGVSSGFFYDRNATYPRKGCGSTLALEGLLAYLVA